MSKAQILDHVWRYDFGGDASVVETYISYLRKKIDAGEDTTPLIQTVRGLDTPSATREADVSLRIRLTAITVLLVGIGLVAAAVATHHYLETFMLDRLDQQLRAAQEGPGPALSAPSRRLVRRHSLTRGHVLTRDTPPSRAEILRDAPHGFSSNRALPAAVIAGIIRVARPRTAENGRLQSSSPPLCATWTRRSRS